MFIHKAMLLGAVVACHAGAITHAAGLTPAYLTSFPHFNGRIGADAPGDVDTALEADLTAKGKFFLVQREFDLYAWQLFNAVNLPDTAPISHQRFREATARWETWPKAQDTEADPKVCADRKRSGSLPAESATRIRYLRVISTLSSNDIVAATAHPSSNNEPLIDQHGNFVYYESLIDPNQVTYICDNGLQSRDGLAKALKSGSVISFPEGSEGTDWSGSYTLKLAWKVLDRSKGDVPSRYYTDDAQILDESANGQPIWRKVTVGLVGMHLVHKTRSAPERIWATFEHVDNLDADTISTPDLEPSFTSPLCPLCVQNRPSRSPLKHVPTQVARVLPIPLNTEKLNAEAQAVLASRGSVWQYYKLVGVQWPGIAGDSTSATPAYLANTVMETFLQPSLIDSQGSGDVKRSTVAASSCMACHERAAVAGEALGQGGAKKVDFSWFMAEEPPAK